MLLSGRSFLKHTLLSGIFLILVILAFSQSPNLKFDHYGLKEGLADQSVGPIVQDSLGFMWFGTLNGVSRFDGYRFKTYEHNPSDSFSLSTNSIGDILIDSKGRMWVGTLGNGLNFYDRTFDRFIRIVHSPKDPSSLSNNYVNEIFEDSGGNIWIGTNRGLNQLDEWDPDNRKAKFRRFPVHQENSIQAIVEMRQGELWLGTSKNGLLRFDMGKNDYQEFTPDESTPSRSLASNLIKSFFKENQQRLWVACFGGISLIEFSSKSPGIPVEPVFHSFVYKKNDSLGLPYPNITQILKVSEREYWLGTFNGGLIRMDMGEEPNFELIRAREDKPDGLASNLINSLLEDRDGNIWLGTDHGVNKISLAYQNHNWAAFKHTKIPEVAENAVQDVLCITQDTEGNTWIGTYGNGIFIFHKKSQSWKRLQPIEGSQKKLSHSIVTTILQDGKGIFWVGTFGGFNRVEINWQAEQPMANIQWFLPQENKPKSLSNKHIFAALDGDSLIWLGTRGGGLNVFHKNRGSFRSFTHDPEKPQSISNNYIWSVIRDGRGRLWMATDGGLNIFDPTNETFIHFKHDPARPTSLSNNFNNLVYRDSKRRVWIGHYGRGIDVIHEDSIDGKEHPNFVHIKAKNGLVNEKIYGIIEDKMGQIWITTTLGLSLLDANQPFPPSAEAFQNFFREDGLQENEFNSGATFINEKGVLFLGGINGYNQFDPADIRKNKQAPSIGFTQIEILNEVVSPAKALQNGNIPLNRNPNMEGRLHLSHEDLVLKVEYAALNYLFPGKNQYAYQLEGFDKGWNYVGTQRTATYTNLHEGDYILRVKASNNDGVWNEKGISLKIHVSPPPWRTWWAYMAYFMTLIALIALFIRYRIKKGEKELETRLKISQAKLEERETVRKNAAADFHDELGNKITKISLFVELAKRQAQMGQETLTFLDKINSHTRELSEGIRDFIWVLDPEQDSYYKVFNRAKEFGDQLFEHTLVDFRVKGIRQEFEEMPISVSQRRHLLMIIKEALHNTLKYAEAKNCTLEINKQELSIRITITDDGKGFDAGKASKGYGLGNMAERAEKIGAEYELACTPGVGTQIHLSLKYLN